MSEINTVQAENFWNAGVMVNVMKSAFSGNARISDESLEEKGFSPEVVKAVNTLFTPEDMKKFKVFSSLSNKCSNLLRKMGIETPFKGLIFIPNERISDANDLLSEYKEKWFSQVNIICRQYSFCKANFQSEYPELYAGCRDKYPTENELRSKYKFEWHFTRLEIPTDLPPELITAEQAKMQERAEQVIDRIMEEFFSALSKRVTQFSEKLMSGELRKDSLNPLFTLINGFQQMKGRFITDDTRQIISEIQTLAESISESEITTKDGKQIEKRIIDANNNLNSDTWAELALAFDEIENKSTEINQKIEARKKRRKLIF